MPPNTSRPPLQSLLTEGVDTRDSSSPARDALQTSRDNSPMVRSLRASKKSTGLFGTLGSMAGRAASIFDRLNQVIAGEATSEPLPSTEDEPGSTSKPHTSIKSPTERPQTKRQSSANIMSKSARGSIRHILTGSSTKHIDNATSSPPSSTLRGRLISPKQDERVGSMESPNSRFTTHSRASSITSTIIGSVRNIGRGSSVKRGTFKTEVSFQTDKIPLPSSPNIIQPPLPPLALDLGPKDFMSTASDSSVEEGQDKIEALVISSDITAGLPDDHGAFIPADLQAPLCTPQITTPANLHENPFESLAPQLFNTPQHTARSSTPMPGTNLPLEVDGNSSKKSLVFERSVEISDLLPAKGTKQLRQMKSINAFARSALHGPAPVARAPDSTDAMVLAATVAHALDEADSATSAKHSGPTERGVHRSDIDGLPSQVRRRQSIEHEVTTTSQQPVAAISVDQTTRDRRESFTASHVSILKDVRRLSQQLAPDRGDLDHRDLNHGLPKGASASQDDPTPPSQESRFVKWQRQHNIAKEKAMQESASQEKAALKQDDHKHSASLKDAEQETVKLRIQNESSLGPPSPGKLAKLALRTRALGFPSRCETGSSAIIALGGGRVHDDGFCCAGEGATAINHIIATPDGLPADHRRGEHSPSLACEDVDPVHEEEAPRRLEAGSEVDSILTDYIEFKTQHLFGLDSSDPIDLPEYDYADGEASASLLNVVSLTPTVDDGVATSHTLCPSNESTGFLRNTNVGSLFYKFRASEWVGPGSEDSVMAAFQSDSISAKEHRVDGCQNEQDAESSTNLGCSTASPAEIDRVPSIGSKHQFDLKRPIRNTGYNALYAENTGHVAEASTRKGSADYTFTNGTADAQDGLQLADFESAFTSSPKVKTGAEHSRNLSSDTAMSSESTIQAIRHTNLASQILGLCAAGVGDNVSLGFSSPPSHRKTGTEQVSNAVTSSRNMQQSVDVCEVTTTTSSPLHLASSDMHTFQAATSGINCEGNAPHQNISEMSPDASSGERTHAEVSPTGELDSLGSSPTSLSKTSAANKFAPPTIDLSSPPKPQSAEQRRAVGYHDRELSDATPDETSRLLSSPDSGYRGDESSMVEPETPVMSRTTYGMPSVTKNVQMKKLVGGNERKSRADRKDSVFTA